MVIRVGSLEESRDDPMDIDPPRLVLKMVAGAGYIPKKNKEKPQGEDAHFICAETCTVGVADGVGAWARMGIDAGEYARELMRKAALAAINETIGDVDPMRILTAAYDGTDVEGSSTACIVTLNCDTLHAVNVGDSGFMVFRDNELVYRSPTQQRTFNTPYQLGKNRDRPSLGVEVMVEVKPRDVVVVGTDGLSDNLYTDEILEVLKGKMNEDPRELACRLARRARKTSLDSYASSPFSLHAQRAGRYRPGGKADDITVIVAHIL